MAKAAAWFSAFRNSDPSFVEMVSFFDVPRTPEEETLSAAAGINRLVPTLIWKRPSAIDLASILLVSEASASCLMQKVFRGG
jgi:hypothetical protein